MCAAVLLMLAVGGAGVWWLVHRPGPQETFREALAALDRGDFRTVVEAARALEADPYFADHVSLLDANLLLRHGQPRRALDELAKLDPKGELREPALLTAAECLYLLGRMAEAEGVLRGLLEDEPDHVDAHRWLGAIYYDLGANGAAIEELNRVIALDPSDYAPHRLLGLIHQDFKQHTQGILSYRKALALTPPATVCEEIVRELSRSLIAERQYQEALELLEGASPDATVLALKAEAHWSLGQRQRALECLEQARGLNPDARLVALLEARMLLDEGRPMEAIRQLERVLVRDPHDAECRYQLALAYRQAGDLPMHEREMSRWKDSSALLSRLTELNEQAVESPRDPGVRDQLAAVCEALGKLELAEMWRKAAAACRSASRARLPSSTAPEATELRR